MLNNQDFTQNRSNFLGGSDIGAVIGVSKYRSALDVWLEKTGKKVDRVENLSLRFGSFAESFVAEEYALATGETLATHAQGLSHPDHPFCIGHIDRFVLHSKDQPLFNSDGLLNAKKLLECKTTSVYSQYDWGEPGSDAVPLPYLCQCLWYLGITGLSQIDLAVLIGGAELKIYCITRDRELETLLFQKAADFWTEHVLKDIPPKPQSVADCQTLFYKGVPDKTKEADIQILRRIQALKVLESEMQASEEVIQKIKQELMLEMGDAEVLTYQGKSLITWKAPKASTRIDTKRLAQEHPELVRQYQTPVHNTRRFVVKEDVLDHLPTVDQSSISASSFKQEIA